MEPSRQPAIPDEAILLTDMGDVGDLTQQLGSKLRVKDITTDQQHIRGTPVLQLMEYNGSRISWTDRDRTLRMPHRAQYQLYLGNRTTYFLDDLIDRMGFTEYVKDISYLTVLTRRLHSAVTYRLKKLHENGHVRMATKKPHTLVWKPCMAAWGEDVIFQY